MRHPALLDRDRTVVLLIDLQERYRTILADWERTVAASLLLVRGAGLLGVPLLVTEQYPAGLGHTVADVAAHFPRDLEVVEKRTMSCCGSGAFEARLAATGRRQVLVAGIEAHACVQQTVHDLLAAGYQVHVARDGISSRRGTRCALPACCRPRASRRCSSSSGRPMRRSSRRYSDC
jgi:hypothetical protein